MATRTVANGGGDWHTSSTWVEGAVPTSADAVVATATSGNVTISANADCSTIVLTGYTGTLTHNAGVALNVHSTATATVLSFPTSMTYTKSSTSEIVLATASANERSFNFGDNRVGTLTYTVASSTGSLKLSTSSNSGFDVLNVSGGRTFKFPSGPITDVDVWNVAGSAGSLVSVESVSTGTPASVRSVAPYADATGNVWTASNRAGLVPGYLDLDQSDNARRAGYISTPDAAVLDLSTSFEIIVKVAPEDWTPSSLVGFISKSSAWGLWLNTAGTVRLNSGASSATSTVATGLANGSTKWVRASWSDPANQATFYLSDDGSAWTQLGAVVALSTAPAANTSDVVLGATAAPSSGLYSGKFYRAIVKDNGSTVIDIDFEAAHTEVLTEHVEFTQIAAAGLVDWPAEYAVDGGDNSRIQFGAGPSTSLGLVAGWMTLK